MRSSWLPHLDARVPRYTSYPTAPHFRAGIGPSRFEDWLAALPPGDPVSLYVHVPFCRRLCWYCGCNTTIVKTDAPVADFVETLLREIDLVADRLPARLRVSHLHFGGGTPNILPPAEFARIVDALAGRFDFASGMEFALEIDPRGLGPDMLTTLKSLGVNRASLGVQDLDPGVQRAINRVQSFETVESAVWGLRAAGVGGINLDLLYGLPRQSEATIERTIGQVARLSPDRVSLFGYAHVPWMKKHQKALERFALPDAAARGRLAMAARTALEGAGLEPIGLDHFAQPDDALAVAARAGRLRRNFQGYTTDAAETLLGLGPSSISATRQGYAQAAPEGAAWAEAVAAGRLAIVKGIEVGTEDRLRRAVIEALMCHLHVDLADMAERHGADPALFVPDIDRLAPLAADGLVQLQGWQVRVPPEARIAIRTVAAAFDTYLRAGEARHAAAV